MRLCFIVDFRSPIARNWIAWFVEAGHEVHVLSTFPASGAGMALASYEEVPVALGWLAGKPLAQRHLAVSTASPAARSAGRRLLGAATRQAGVVLRSLHSHVAALDVPRYAERVRGIVSRIAPDLVHAMRIPYEGMLAAEALAGTGVPLLVSVWGNDFTLFAEQYPLTARATRRTLRIATALHTDCLRDRRLALDWGWAPERPSVVLPGSGGVQLDVFAPGETPAQAFQRWQIPRDRPLIFNARNFRPGYVRNDVFFAAIPLVLARRPDAFFACIGMAGNPVAERWRERSGCAEAIRLLPAATRAEMAELFRMAEITISPSMHDGTPNTLLEGMACGAFPVAGDIESVREWIVHGETGLLCDPTDPRSVADALLDALADPARRRRAAIANRAAIVERAAYDHVMASAERFYGELAAVPRPVEVS